MSEWPLRSGRFNRNRGPVIVKDQPTITTERLQLAEKFIQDFDLSSDLFFIDICERQDPFENAYAPWPLRLYLIMDRKVEWIAMPKDCSYDEAVQTLLKLLKLDMN